MKSGEGAKKEEKDSRGRMPWGGGGRGVVGGGGELKRRKAFWYFFYKSSFRYFGFWYTL